MHGKTKMDVKYLVADTSEQEIKVPGKKVFGFMPETRMFVSSVEEGSTAAELLSPGDEIVQV